MLHMLQWLYTYIAKVCFQCFICVFASMLQVCFMWMLHTFHTYVTSVFIWILCMLCNGFQVFSICFLSVSEACFSSVSSAFKRMLQVLHLDASKVNRVLRLPRLFSIASPQCLLLLRAPAGHPPPPTPLPDVSDVRGGARNLSQKQMGRA
jgi:hypothetical protein